MRMLVIQTVYLSLAVGAMSMTIAKARVFRPLRELITRRSEKLGELISCPYCTSHWVSFIFTAVYFPRILVTRFVVLDWFVAAMAVVALSSVTCALIYHAYGHMRPNLENIEND
jgi:hypothetical protein